MKTTEMDLKNIAIEDIATVFACEFIKVVKDIPKFKRMNYKSRRSVVSKVLDSLEKNLVKY